MSAPPYSTGGGGVTLEHTYAACLLAALLAGEPITELGTNLTPASIRLQAGNTSPIDDIVVEGHDAVGAPHRASIGVRRDPKLTKSERKSVPLIRDYLRIVTDHWESVSSGVWSLTLAVATQRPAHAELGELAVLARSVPDAVAFATAVSRPGATNKNVRGRLKHLEDLVTQAAGSLVGASTMNVEELTWRLLSGLYVRSLRLEGADTTDRTAAVSALRRVVIDDSVTTADSVFSRIEGLTGEWASHGAIVTEGMLRRQLSSYPLKRSSTYSRAWDVLDRLATRLRKAIRPTLESASQSLELERPDERARLTEAVRSVGEDRGTLVVTGDPDVGKSALALRVVEDLRDEGVAVLSLSLRDLPSGVTEFENQIGGTIDAVLATAEVRPSRLLLIDGAEAVLEGKDQVFRTLAAAAASAGIGVVAVTRTDGSNHVVDDLIRACETTHGAQTPARHVVGPLTDSELDILPATFSALARFSGDPRASWLLGRLGLVDALLRIGRVVEPANVLCEADVFSAVWRGLVRNDERREQGAASADDREQAAMRVAERTLGMSGKPSRGTAAAELRSDGVLRVPDDPALSPGDEFATDLFRDFALCRLFITNGWENLANAGAPRWSIRAARLACQASLRGGNRLRTWSALATHFGQIASEHGDRWSEVPYEALLTLSDAESAIQELREPLTEDDYGGLRTLLRLAQLRYVNGTIGDPFALVPVVGVIFCGGWPIDRGARMGSMSMSEVIQQIVLAWLRGMASASRGEDQLRRRVRDVILESEPPLYDDFAIEALASMGPDIDDRTEEWLRKVAAERPGSLHPAVESFSVAASMSQTHPHLLLDLAESYYVKRPEPEGPQGGGMHTLDGGIRDFRHGLGPGFGVPQAAWYYGPFFRLLNTVPADAIAFINRVLNHASKFRVEKLASLSDEAGGHNELEGLDLDYPSVGARRYIGDSHVWAWYRGTSVGPYACMSALLALERFIDHLHETLNLPARTVVELLMRDCHNVAVPGLVVGFLTRHPGTAGDLIDPFLARPEVWHLEAARVTGEHGLRLRDPDADKLTGANRRSYTPHQTVGSMVVDARLRGDEDRLVQLEQVGTQLVDNARSQPTGSPGDKDWIAVIDSWAAEFRIENYQAAQSDDGVIIQFERPEQIEQVLTPRNQEMQTTNTLYGLQNRYAPPNDSPSNWAVDELTDDLATTRRIAEGEVPQDFLWPEDSLTAVAVTAVRAHALGLFTIDQDDLKWAAEAVMWAAENPRIDAMTYHGTTFPTGADRAAAVAAPLLLLAPFDDLSLDRERLEGCLSALASSIFDEVRMAYARGCEPLWEAACAGDPTSGRCMRHQPAWDAAEASLADCKLGPWSQKDQQRLPEEIRSPFHEALPAVKDDDLLVNHLRMPVVCMVDAKDLGCVREAINNLWTPLWDAHRRGLNHEWREGYDHIDGIHHEPIARRLVALTLNGDRTPLEAHLKTLAKNANPLHLLLESLATVFTYDGALRDSLTVVWPRVMRVTLDTIGDGAALRDAHHWFDYAVAAILPVPRPRSWDSDIDATLDECRRNWIQPEALEGLDERWLHLARSEPKAVDAVVKFARSAPLKWQTGVALTWIETIIDGRFDLFANHIWGLEEWLTDLRKTDLVASDVKSHYHRIVDGLAAAGDHAAVRLQQLDE